jgi:hypothetical protein
MKLQNMSVRSGLPSSLSPRGLQNKTGYALLISYILKHIKQHNKNALIYTISTGK